MKRLLLLLPLLLLTNCEQPTQSQDDFQPSWKYTEVNRDLSSSTYLLTDKENSQDYIVIFYDHGVVMTPRIKKEQ